MDLNKLKTGDSKKKISAAKKGKMQRLRREIEYITNEGLTDALNSPDELHDFLTDVSWAEDEGHIGDDESHQISKEEFRELQREIATEQLSEIAKDTDNPLSNREKETIDYGERNDLLNDVEGVERTPRKKKKKKSKKKSKKSKSPKDMHDERSREYDEQDEKEGKQTGPDSPSGLPDWLSNMSESHRKAYFEEHPKSKYATKAQLTAMKTGQALTVAKKKRDAGSGSMKLYGDYAHLVLPSGPIEKIKFIQYANRAFKKFISQIEKISSENIEVHGAKVIGKTTEVAYVPEDE